MKAFILNSLDGEMGEFDVDLGEGESRSQKLLKLGLDQFDPIEGKAQISSDEKNDHDANQNEPLLHPSTSSSMTSLKPAEVIVAK
jgi:hypothetical protein